MIYFVATPIGNLKDISLRALEVLKSVDVIYCEDTRHTIKLLNAYEIKKPLKACHKFNETEAALKIVEDAKEGKEIAIVSDAGMPVISDPGNVVCGILKENNVNYTIVPGANAFLSALILSGLPADKFAFIGFLPERAGQRKKLLEKYKDLDMTLCFHSAKQDVDKDIKTLYEVFGNRRASAVREITKLHEEAINFNLEDGLEGEKIGEYVLIIEGNTNVSSKLCDLEIKDHILYYINEGMEKKDAIKQVAKDRGVAKSEIYPYSIDLEETK